MVARSPPGGSWGSILDPAGALPKQPYKAAPSVLWFLFAFQAEGKPNTAPGVRVACIVNLPPPPTPLPPSPRVCAETAQMRSLDSSSQHFYGDEERAQSNLHTPMALYDYLTDVKLLDYLGRRMRRAMRPNRQSFDELSGFLILREAGTPYWTRMRAW